MTCFREGEQLCLCASGLYEHVILNKVCCGQPTAFFVKKLLHAQHRRSLVSVFA